MPTDRAVTAPPPGDEGMSLLEVMMAIFLIGTVMAAAAPFLVTSVALSNRQRADQAAVQIANGAVERVRAIKPTSLVTGRDMATADEQWKNAPAKVAEVLAHMQMITDSKAGPDDGPKAALPTRELDVVINNITYHQQWYVGRCWQAKVPAAPATPAATPAPSITCGKAPNGVPFVRVVIAVSWKHAACPADCLYVASTLVSDEADPVFDTNRPPPKVGKVVAQYSYTGEEATYQITSSDGRLPLKWTAAGLPPGLTMDADSGQIKGTPTKAGTYTPVTVEVTDKDGLSDDADFTWNVADNLVPPTPAAHSTRNNIAVTETFTATGGFAPLKWSATGLPAGLTMSSGGVVTGRTATTGAVTTRTVITVTDSGPTPRVRTAEFDWYVGPPPLTLAPYSPESVPKGTSVNYDLSPLARGGVPSYTWSATNIPPGLSMDPATGRVTGTMRYATQYITTVTVADKSGQTKSIDVTVRVTAGGDDLRVTAPSGGTQTTPAGTAITSFPVSAAGANPPSHTWTAAQLPPGVAISSTGTITGTPTTPGTYRVTLTVKNLKNDQANLMFDWIVT